MFRSSVQDGQTDKQIEDKTEISTVVREKVDPGGGTTFDVLVFKEPVGGKVYVYV